MMTEKEYYNLKEEALKLIFAAMEDRDELMEPFEMAAFDIRELPYHEEIVITLMGIIGSHRYLKDKKGNDINGDFLINAIHDVYECIRHYDESWYSPRLSRYAYYGKETGDENNR